MLRVRVGRDTLHAEAVHRGAVSWVGESPYADVSELADALGRLAAEPPQACRRLVVTLECPPAQLRTLTGLPPVKPQALATLVAHQASRFFRKNGGSLATDAVWLGDPRQSAVRAAAVEEPLVEAIVAGARAAGLMLETIRPAGETMPLALFPASERAARRRAQRLAWQRLAAATLAVWLLAALAFTLRLVVERRAVERDLARLGAPVAAVIAARRELRDAEATVQAIGQVERLRGRSLAVLSAVTAALPDSSVLTSLTWRDDGSGLLTGAARRAAEVVADLDRASAVPSPRLEGPAVRETIAGREWERFTIAFGREEGRGKGEGS